MQPAEEKVLYAYEVHTLAHGKIWTVAYDSEAAIAA